MAGGAGDREQYLSERPTQPLGALTRPLEALGKAEAPRWSCGRCQGPVEPFSQGHYSSVCLLTVRETGFHFCCPGRCERETA